MSKLLHPTSRLRRLLGRIRLWHGFCPRCNSDAPWVDKCAVCKSVHEGGVTVPNNRQQYPPSIATKALWWYCWVHPSMIDIQVEWEGRSWLKRQQVETPRKAKR